MGAATNAVMQEGNIFIKLHGIQRDMYVTEKGHLVNSYMTFYFVTIRFHCRQER